MGSTRDCIHPTRPAQKGSQTSNHDDNKGNPPPLPPHSHTQGCKSPIGLQLTTAKDNSVKPHSKVPPTVAPPQAHPCLLTSPEHDTLMEATKELLIQLENSMQEKMDCEAMLLKDLKDFNVLMNDKPNSSK